MSKISPQLENLCCSMYKEGAKIADICKELAISEATVYNILRRNSIPKRNKPTKSKLITEADLERLASDYIEGVSLAELETTYNVTSQFIYKMLRTKDIKPNRKSKPKKRLHDQIVTLYAEKQLPVYLILERLKCSPNTIYKALRTAGINTRQKRQKKGLCDVCGVWTFTTKAICQLALISYDYCTLCATVGAEPITAILSFLDGNVDFEPQEKIIAATLDRINLSKKGFLDLVLDQIKAC